MIRYLRILYQSKALEHAHIRALPTNEQPFLVPVDSQVAVCMAIFRMWLCHSGFGEVGRGEEGKELAYIHT